MNERYNPDKGEWVTVQGGRSPSPEPIYDRNGRRSNTRDLRLRDRLQKERVALIEKMMTLQPATAALGGQIKFQNAKRSTKLFVPIKEYPGYPFIGLILGPRGNTQKKLERETGTKIVIRGKGRCFQYTSNDIILYMLVFIAGDSNRIGGAEQCDADRECAPARAFDANGAACAERRRR